MKDIVTITHSDEGIRVSCDGTTRSFANAVYLAEAYAANVLAARRTRETIRGEAAACLAAIAEIGAKVVDIRGTVGGELFFEKLNELGELMTDAGAGLANF